MTKGEGYGNGLGQTSNFLSMVIHDGSSVYEVTRWANERLISGNEGRKCKGPHILKVLKFHFLVVLIDAPYQNMFKSRPYYFYE